MIGSIIGPALGLIGGLFGQSADRKAREAAEAAAAGRFNEQMEWSREQFDRNEALQREFAQSGVRWRTADAKAAGIHPIFALGGAGASYSPTVTAGGDNFTGSGDGGGRYLAQMGQDVGRAIAATSTRSERIDSTMAALGLEHAQLQNDLLKAQIAKMTGQIGPPAPELGNAAGLDGSFGHFEIKNEITPSQPNHPAQQAGPAVPNLQWSHVGDGLVAYPAQGVAGLDDMDITSPLAMEWIVRNRVAPFFGSKQNKPPMQIVRHYWPWATGVYYSRSENKWKPQGPSQLPNRSGRLVVPGRQPRSGSPDSYFLGVP